MGEISDDFAPASDNKEMITPVNFAMNDNRKLVADLSALDEIRSKMAQSMLDLVNSIFEDSKDAKGKGQIARVLNKRLDS